MTERRETPQTCHDHGARHLPGSDGLAALPAKLGATGLLALLLLLLGACSDHGGQGNDNNSNDNGSTCEASTELPDNGVDEDCDGWLDTSRGFQVRASHPRVLIHPEGLDAALDRMVGTNARDPYQRWLELLIESEDGGTPVDLVSLALIFRATGDSGYRDSYLDRLPQEGDPSLDELLSLDLMWDEVPDAVKEAVMDRVAANPDVWYWNSINQSQEEDVSWGYHAAHGVSRALAYAGIFALTDLELSKDPQAHPFDTLNYIHLVQEELSDTGFFRQMENRIAGDPTHNDALPGDFGGMYDNIGYDSAEESYSVNVLAEMFFLTGEDRFTGFLHDQYRARFYQNMQYPHLYSSYDSDQWCRRAGTEPHIIARIWNTQTDWISQPRATAVSLTAWLFSDERMQYYAENGVWRELCGEPYGGMYWELLFFRDDLTPRPPSDNPTAMYFSGPGLVSMREDWSKDAAFGVFIAGEGISRRYEDANSFLIHRKVDVFPHGGARIRNNPDNSKHHWYHIRSAAKNTLKIFDPDESLDLDSSSNRGPLHSGPPLVPSDNLGGQMFETATSENDLDFTVWNGGATPSRTTNPDDPLGLYEVANVIKYEHVPGEYTYAVGDGTASYTRKIDFFEREFLFLRPRTFVIFDRVQSTNPNFKKVWVVHTVDEPQVAASPNVQTQGMRAYVDAFEITIDNPANVTYLDTLLPESNRVVLRGGDTVLAENLVLRPQTPVTSGQVTDSDNPRWLEVFAVGPDTEGAITITGDAEEGTGISEEVVFDSTVQQYMSSVPTAPVAAGTLEDTTQSWTVDQWAGYQVHIHCGNSDEQVVITGNDAHTLFGTFTPCSAWAYNIERPVANTYYHWTHITGITTTDMDVDFLTLSVPHYFDAEDILGRVHSFSPHTDSRDDGYRKRPDLGQWTLEIEATEPALLDHFLNVIHLDDPGQARPATSLLQSAEAAGALVGDRFAIFARTTEPLTGLTMDIPHSSPLTGLVLDLEPDTTYHVLTTGNTLEISLTDNGGASHQSSSMGVLSLEMP